MSNNKDRKQSNQTVLERVKKEMAEPRVTGSAQMEAKGQHAGAGKEAGRP
jgi:hypothetical protein